MKATINAPPVSAITQTSTAMVAWSTARHSSKAMQMLALPSMRSSFNAGADGARSHTCNACTCIDNASHAMPVKLLSSAAASIRLAASCSDMRGLLTGPLRLRGAGALAQPACGDGCDNRSGQQ